MLVAMRFVATVLATLLLSAPALAQTPGNCALGRAEADLNIADVQARLFNTGSLFYGGSTTNGIGYVVPKDSLNTSPLFAAGIWVAGLVDGDLRAAGSRYDDFEFWPGPLNEDGTLPSPDDCSIYDRIWNVSVFDLQQYEETGTAPFNVANWPIDLGAPFTDANNDGEYDLEDGDRPLIYGHQTAFWVMNDVGNDHLESQTLPIGLEVRVTAFASAEEGLGQYTFYRYEVVNRNSQPLEDAYFTLFVDPDLGDAADDYVGSDSTRGMAFTYNEAEEDGVYGIPPAVGYDFLTGADAATYFQSTADPALGDPDLAIYKYNHMRGIWSDGTPLTEGFGGYETDGDTIMWAFPGNPVTGEFWSEENADGQGNPNPSGDRRNLITSPPFTLAPSEARTFDLALLFKQGTDRLHSVALLQEASDAIQFRYDQGRLYEPAPPIPAPGLLATPQLLGPEDGGLFVETFALLAWTAVPKAERYRIEIARDPDFVERDVFYSEEPSFGAGCGIVNEIATCYWRVKAIDGFNASLYSDSRSFQTYFYANNNFGQSVGIIEVANPDGDVCPDPDDPGCAAGYPGNTVWLSPNATDDYVLTNPDNDLGDLFRDIDTTEDDNFEWRFTKACATAGACLGIYSSAAPIGTDLITSVPFELWNIGTEADSEDDVRMIPVLRALNGGEPVANWADAYHAEQAVIAGSDTLVLGVTQSVIGMMPDRPTGYALFEAAANGFGGVGATYDPETDGDTQEEIYTDPRTGEQEPCRSQRYYIDFCYRNGDARFVGVLGGLDGMVVADLAGDGTTPAVGTVIRFDAVERLLTDSEDETPTQPTRFALGAAYPNPFRASATIPFEVGQAGTVRLAVVDVLGREVAVLEDGEMPTGTHRATLDGSRLASGVYLVVLEADGHRQATKVLLLR